MKSTTTVVEILPTASKASKISMELSLEDLAKVIAGLAPGDLHTMFESVESNMFIKTDRNKRKVINVLKDVAANMERNAFPPKNIYDVM